MPRVLALITVAALTAAIGECANIDRTSWRLTQPTGESDTVIHIGVQVGGCDEFERIDVRETEVDVTGRLIGVVTIEAFIETGVRSDCPDILLEEEHTVELDEPLGNRPLSGCSPPSARYGSASDPPNDDCGAQTFPE